VLFASIGFSQNLVPNPSFEIFTFCPTMFNTGQPLQCVPWISATPGTSDYFNACAPENPPMNSVNVPNNFIGQQAAHTGVAYAGGFHQYIFPYREYLQAPLLQPLVAGEYYYFSMFVSLADFGTCGIEHLGAYFSVTPPPPNGVLWLNVTPQVESQIGYVSNYDGWTLIDGCFFAAGGEAYITIGNFNNDTETMGDPLCTGGNEQITYYYVDDVSLSVTTLPAPLDIELGDPVSACAEYTIEPGIPDVFYHWEDGSDGETLTVTESGTYSLTITAGCSYGIDSLEVEIIGNDLPVDIGDALYVMCAGEEYTITLDPDAGDYEWSDGSTDNEFTITTAGTYSVTLNDDDCDLTSDEVEVTVIDPPAPFTLGPDTYFCPGDELSFSFDPALGDFAWSDGDDSPDHTLDIPGIYALTISNMCGEYTDEIEIAEIIPPFVSFDPDPVILCEGEILEIELDPNMGDFVWQDGSTNNFYAITGSGHFWVNVINECGTDHGDIYVEEVADPTFDLGPDQYICSAQLPILLDVSNSGGETYLWQDGSTEDNFLITAEGNYSVTVTNACNSASDDIEIVVEDVTLNVSLPADQVLCPGETFVLSNSGDTGSYQWQDNSTADTLLVSAPGTYSVTVSTFCSVGVDTIVINYSSPVVVPDLGSDFSLCPGEQAILSPGISGVSYLWQDFSTADSFLVTTSGIYYVQVADQCTSASDTVQVTLNNNPPQLSLPQQISLCQGNSFIIDAGINGVTYTWNDGSNADSLLVSTPGNYSLTVSNSCGADVDTVVILDGGPAPSVALGNDIALCPGDVVTLTPTFSDVTSWLWNDSSTGSSYSVSNAELITVAVSNSCGTTYDTLTSTLLPATPPLDLGLDTSLCPGNTLLLEINTPGVTIQWSDGSVNSQYLINGPGEYFATIANSCGENADTINVGLLPAAPNLDLGIDQSLCPGEVITFDPGVQNVTYVWQDGSVGSSFNATQAGLIILSITNSCGSATDTVEIVESTEGPDVNLGPDVLACNGDVVTLASDISGVNYLWQDGSSNSSFTTSSSGTFFIEVSNNCGVDRDTIVVDINGNAPATELGPDTTLCTGSSLILTSTSDPGTTLTWQDGSNSTSLIVTSPGTYTLSESNHCGDHTDAIHVDFLDAPQPFTLGPDTTLCPGESILLTIPFGGYNILWQDGSTGTSIVANKEQSYSLELSNQCGLFKDELSLAFDHNIPLVDLDPSITICPGDEVLLDVTQNFDAEYEWSTGATLPVINIVTPGMYSVSVIALCAEAEGNVVIVQDSDCFPVSFYVPNLFSPNHDNVNDVFSLHFNDEVEITALHGSIFDRWGNHVFDSKAIPFEWNGQFNGELMQPGVYVYVIDIVYKTNGQDRQTILQGDVTLVR
jgi:gliding motility-associated-like protein